MVRFQTYSNLTGRKNPDCEVCCESATLRHIMDNTRTPPVHETIVKG